MHLAEMDRCGHADPAMRRRPLFPERSLDVIDLGGYPVEVFQVDAFLLDA